MRGRRAGLAWGAALLAMLLLAPPGVSVTGSGVVTAALPVQLWGPLEADAPLGGLVARGGQFTANVLVERGRVEVTTWELTLGPLGGLTRTTEVVAGPGARLELRPGDAAQLLALGHARLSTTGQAQMVAPAGDAFLVEHGGEALALPFPEKATAVRAAEGVGTVEGPMHLFLTDAAVRVRRGAAEVFDLDLSPVRLLRVDGLDVDLAPAEGPTSGPLAAADRAAQAWGLDRAADLDGLTLQEVLVQRVLEVKGDGLLVARTAGADLQAFARAPVVHVVGAVALPQARGDVALVGRPVQLRGETAQAAGDFWLRAMPADGDGAERRMSLSGAFTTFAVNGRLVEAPPAAQGALALGALAALGLASPLLKPLLGRLYARIPTSEVLASEPRRRLFELVQAEPGLSLSELSAKAALSWGNTVHHLSVLKRAGLVTSLRHGRYRRWFACGALEQERRGQVAALRNATSARVARLILAQPGMSQKQLADALAMTPQAAHWHLVRLSQAGLVERVREGREVRHYVRAAPPSPGPPQPAAAPVAVSAAARGAAPRPAP